MQIGITADWVSYLWFLTTASQLSQSWHLTRQISSLTVSSDLQKIHSWWSSCGSGIQTQTETATGVHCLQTGIIWYSQPLHAAVLCLCTSQQGFCTDAIPLATRVFLPLVHLASAKGVVCEGTCQGKPCAMASLLNNSYPTGIWFDPVAVSQPQRLFLYCLSEL